jgi:hypothetical protein
MGKAVERMLELEKLLAASEPPPPPPRRGRWRSWSGSERLGLMIGSPGTGESVYRATSRDDGPTTAQETAALPLWR